MPPPCLAVSFWVVIGRFPSGGCEEVGLGDAARGMDVGAKEDVIRILQSLRDRGVAILVLSTEPETILTLADRVTVMKRGVVSREFAAGRITKSDLLAAA